MTSCPSLRAIFYSFFFRFKFVEPETDVFLTLPKLWIGFAGSCSHSLILCLFCASSQNIRFDEINDTKID